MSSAAPPPPTDDGAPSIVDVDAAIVFRHPLAVVLLVTFVVGALDALGFQQFSELKDVRVVALCDADTKIMGGVAKKFPDAKTYQDLRKLLDDKNVDAVVISAPDHWHCLPFLAACEAGKDIYVEKPLANSIAECDAMVAYARKYNRVVQVGQQQRSSGARRWSVASISTSDGRSTMS